MPDQFIGAAVQIILALIASGVAVKLLTIRQDRRKIAGEASTQEANAASTLSGAALEMVKTAQASARDAESRSSEANVRAEDANKRAHEANKNADKLWRELNKARWEIYWLRLQERLLEEVLAENGIKVPKAPRPHSGQDFPNTPPPDADFGVTYRADMQGIDPPEDLP